jgi:hypothetical protein
MKNFSEVPKSQIGTFCIWADGFQSFSVLASVLLAFMKTLTNFEDPY